MLKSIVCASALLVASCSAAPTVVSPQPPENVAGSPIRGAIPGDAGARFLLEAVDTASETYLDLVGVPSGPHYTIKTDGYAPIGVAFGRSGKTAYAWFGTYDRSNKAVLAIIDVTKGKIVAKVITTGCGATLALTPDGKTAVADNPCNDSVVLVSLRSRKVRASVPLTGLSNPTGLALDSTGKTAYVVGNGGMAIVDIQHARQIAGVPLPGGSCWQDSVTGVALAEGQRRAYAATCDQTKDAPLVAVVDTQSHRLVQTIDVGNGGAEWPLAVVASTRRPYVYVAVANFDGVTGQLVAIDTRTKRVSKNEALSWAPAALAMSSNGEAVFATTWQGVVWFDTAPGGFQSGGSGLCCASDVDGFGSFVY